jgi:hypothetical protein
VDQDIETAKIADNLIDAAPAGFGIAQVSLHGMETEVMGTALEASVARGSLPRSRDHTSAFARKP